jgi:hypothetical protein
MEHVEVECVGHVEVVVGGFFFGGQGAVEAIHGEDGDGGNTEALDDLETHGRLAWCGAASDADDECWREGEWEERRGRGSGLGVREVVRENERAGMRCNEGRCEVGWRFWLMGDGSLGTEVSVPLSLISNQRGRGGVYSGSGNVVESVTATFFPLL